MIAGSLLLGEYSDAMTRWLGGPLPVYHLYRIMVMMVVASFIVTILVEWPFYWLAMRLKAGWKKILAANIVANLGSYALLIGWYYLVSVGPMHWGVRLVVQRQRDSARLMHGIRRRSSVSFPTRLNIIESWEHKQIGKHDRSRSRA